MTREEILIEIKPEVNKYLETVTKTGVKQVSDARFICGYRSEEYEYQEEITNFERMEQDKKTRFDIALQDGQDPFNEKSLEELYNDWQFVFKYRKEYNK